MGPVHENETKANVKAIKKIPIIPPLSAPLSAKFTHFDGRVISNAPKKDKAKIKNTTKKAKFTQGLVDISLSADGPSNQVTTNPSKT